ncbi:MAG: hypothetical protein ACRDOT_00490 [Aeromicrobium sp.]
MRMRSAAVLALVLALTACGGDAKPKAEASKASAKKAAMDGALPNVADGRPVPEALSDFVCEHDDKGTWKASGAVTNRSKEPVSFQVTVHVGSADGQGAPASTKRISSVQKNGSVGFELDEIETRAPDGACHVQVLALAS